MSNPLTSLNHQEYSDTEEDGEEMLSFEDDPSSRIGQSESSEENSLTTSLLHGSSRPDKKSQGEPMPSSQNTGPTGVVGTSSNNGDINGKESFWWIRHKEQGASAGSTQGWRHSKSSVSTVYHSAEDVTDYMSEVSTNSGDTLRSEQSYHSVLRNGGGDDHRDDQEDIFSSPIASPIQERKVWTTLSLFLLFITFVFFLDGETAPIH